MEAEWRRATAPARIQADLRRAGWDRSERYATPEEEEASKRRGRRTQAERLREAARWVEPWDSRRNKQSRIFQCGRVSQFGDKDDCYFGQRSNGDVALYGTQSCGRNSQCAVCRRKVAAHHSEEIGTAIQRWIQMGNHVGFFTLTVRHSLDDEALAIVKGLKESWAMLTSGRLWHEWRTRHGAEFVIAIEPKWSETGGWHVHFHGMLFTRIEVDPLEMKEWLFDRWSHAVRSSDHLGSEHVGDWWHAVDWQTVKGGEKDLGKYLAKMGFELTGDLNKNEQRNPKSGRTPWAILDDGYTAHEMAVWARKRGELEEAERLQRFAENQTRLWSEYTASMYRVKWVQWSQKIRAELALGSALDDSDEEAVALLEEEKGAVVVRRRIPHEIRRTVMYHRHLKRTIIDALERNIEVEPLLEPYLSATEMAYWSDGNSHENLEAFAERIAARTLERKRKRHEQAQEKARVAESKLLADLERERLADGSVQA